MIINTRPPAVAGSFYPGDPATLSATVERLLADADAVPGIQPKALIVPHAGYVYSGSTAATAYATLAPWAKTIRRVILLGPTHRVAVRGLAVPTTVTCNDGRSASAAAILSRPRATSRNPAASRQPPSP